MNTITIELCAEDRARLDAIIEKLDNKNQCSECARHVAEYVKNALDGSAKAKSQPAPKKATASATAPKTTTPEPPYQEASPFPEPEAEPVNEETPPWEEPAAPAEPSVTLAQIQQKVVQLCADQAGGKKAKVREIISAYGSKVSDLKGQPEKWDEVWGKLTALEG